MEEVLDKPLISIIVPIYKVEEYLNECVESLIKQTYTNLEIILVDDGSPDRCPEMCDHWATKDGRIRVVHKTNGGLSSARNAGIEVAIGEYIGFVDSDDFVHEQMYEKLAQGFVGRDNVGITACLVSAYRDGEITPYGKGWDIKQPQILSYAEFNVAMIRLARPFMVWNKLYRRDLIGNIRFREGRNNEDTLFMYDISTAIEEKRMNMYELPDYFYYYRIRPNSICTAVTKPLALEVLHNYADMMADAKMRGRQAVYDAIYYRNIIVLITFNEQLLVKPAWKQLYYKEYRRKLLNIQYSYIQVLPKNHKRSYLMMRFAPLLRKWILQYKRSHELQK